MILTVCLDESGTHADWRISVMAGYVGTAAQWKHVEADWAALVAKAGVRHIHAVDLFRRTKQFRGWKSEDVDALALALDGVIARYLQLGFVVIRDDNYKNTYGAGPHPKRPVKDTKYGVCFRACLAFVPSFIASELKLAGQGALAEPTRIDFALEGGHANVADARRLFELYKYVADTPMIANNYPRAPVPQSGPMLFRIPITRDVLQSLKDDLFAIEAERRVRTAP